MQATGGRLGLAVVWVGSQGAGCRVGVMRAAQHAAYHLEDVSVGASLAWGFAGFTS